MFMQKLINLVPLILLTVLSSYLFFTEPNIAQSIILASLAGLSGYRYYLESKKQIDYAALFTERLDKKDIEIKEILSVMEKSVNEIREKQGTNSVAKSVEERVRNIGW
jgi:positive regulator of sigma E activity